jgi:hypothetical protein
MDTIAYRVGAKYVYNIYPALYESMQSGNPVGTTTGQTTQ